MRRLLQQSIQHVQHARQQWQERRLTPAERAAVAEAEAIANAQAATYQAQTEDEAQAASQARWDEMQTLIAGLDPRRWLAGHYVIIYGTVIGVVMTYLPDGYTILAKSADDLARVERSHGPNGVAWEATDGKVM